MTALPTRKQEAWRYADLKAVERLWPLAAPEDIHVVAGEVMTRALVVEGSDPYIRDYHVHVGPKAKAALHILNLSHSYGRISLKVTLQEGADFTLTGIQIGAATQMLEIVSDIKHAAPNATSQQIVRTVVAEHATGTYLGKIEVAKDAQKTRASQSSKALLLARTATINTKPELIIHADDVQCAHGATVGELDKTVLFYLTARGIDPQAARALLIQAFFADSLDAIEDEALRDATAAKAMARLAEVLPHAE
jgi:Fe-S cluster assembly protein SufD